MRIVRAIPEMWVSPTFMLVANSLWPADDPLVVAHPEWFTADLEALLHRSGTAVERKRTTATQEPVEAR